MKTRVKPCWHTRIGLEFTNSFWPKELRQAAGEVEGAFLFKHLSQKGHGKRTDHAEKTLETLRIQFT